MKGIKTHISNKFGSSISGRLEMNAFDKDSADDQAWLISTIVKMAMQRG